MSAKKEWSKVDCEEPAPRVQIEYDVEVYGPRRRCRFRS